MAVGLRLVYLPGRGLPGPFRLDLRLSNMHLRTYDEQVYLKCRRTQYKAAFEEWAIQVKRLQAIKASPCDCSELQHAEARAASAELAYRHSRDRLIEGMLGIFPETDRCSESKSLFAAV